MIVGQRTSGVSRESTMGVIDRKPDSRSCKISGSSRACGLHLPFNTGTYSSKLLGGCRGSLGTSLRLNDLDLLSLHLLLNPLDLGIDP